MTNRCDSTASSRPQPSVVTEMVSVKRLSFMLDVSEKTIWDWIYKNRRRPSYDPIPYHKLGSLVRFRVDEIRAWVDRREVRPLPRVT